jgi:hypothetical protein
MTMKDKLLAAMREIDRRLDLLGDPTGALNDKFDDLICTHIALGEYAASLDDKTRYDPNLDGEWVDYLLAYQTEGVHGDDQWDVVDEEHVFDFDRNSYRACYEDEF